jgi:hypothetical protein
VSSVAKNHPSAYTIEFANSILCGSRKEEINHEEHEEKAALPGK